MRTFDSKSLTLQTRRARLYALMKLLIALSFIVTVAADSLAIASATGDGRVSCPMACCRPVMQNKPYSSLSRVCCVTHCKEPAGTQGPSATTILSEARYRDPAVAHAFSNPEMHPASTKNLTESPAANLIGSSDRYLQSCSLLI